MHPEEFSRRVLRWFDDHGRKHLPWQRQPTPYRVWISEIMLQQTQVATVIPYYERFMARFPDVSALAAAGLDEVLHLWSGLGYYARARHLHQTAMIIRDQYGGTMPLDFATLASLPGIGRSTTGAILALATHQRHPILDGNVKRLLARFQAVEGWPGHAEVLATLWKLAERYTPHQRVAEYTQAMMDLGALICTRSRPRCHLCPVVEGCEAHAQGREKDFPVSRPARELPVRAIRMLLLRTSAGEVLLEKRPPTGVWGGLWSFPECPVEVETAAWCHDRLGLEVLEIQPWEMLRHTFSHFHLDITPLHIAVKNPTPAVLEGERFVWYNIRQPDERGLAAPVQRLLTLLADNLVKERAMARMVKCVKLGREAEGLDRPPYPGELGRRIYENVSREAWQQWLRHQTMLINEYRLTPIEPQARKFLAEQMEQFFFGAGAALPEEYVPLDE